MRCPFCDFDNIEGVDQCSRCNVDLTDVQTLQSHADIELDLLHKPLGDLVKGDFVTVSPDTSVGEVAKRLDAEGQPCALVVDDGRVVGIMTERDFLNRLADDFAAHSSDPVSQHMTPGPELLGTHDAVAFALNKMMVGGYRHIPVTSNGKIHGVVSIRDITDYVMATFPEALCATDAD